MNSSAFRVPAGLTRRRFLRAAAGSTLAVGCSPTASHRPNRESIDRMIVLGVDGMDPALLERFIGEGRMPNCRRLIERGSFRRLQTSDPPQSPVAWSNFISGTNPGGHGIFDFIARDPQTMLPYHSTARLEGGSDPLEFGRWTIPLSAAQVRNLRQGPTFWNQLEHSGIDCTIFRVPANFPPTESEARTLSGMGTPDLQGGYGTFTFFTNDAGQRTRDVAGGRIERIVVQDDRVDCRLRGPANPYVVETDTEEIELTVYVDAERPLAKIVVQESAVILKEGEWSDWVHVRFRLLPYVAEISGICRLLLKSVRDPFALYVSPINMDPADPPVPVSTPADYSRELVRELGYFHTQGMIEDTHALSAGVLTAEEYRAQSTFVIEERLRFFEHEINRFERGFLFFYFSSLDLNSHVFWRTLDRDHPAYSESLANSHGDFIPELYERIDQAIGQAMDRLDDRTMLMVMSDHGFTSFRRQFNLNSWLLDNGYAQLTRAAHREAVSYLAGVDWERTQAYGLGLNSLYLNLQGREAHGTVPPGEAAQNLEAELIDQLTRVRDPQSGERVISNVFRASQIYSGPHLDLAPDLIVAYNDNYRASWDTILGGFPREHILDNQDAWSGDHCIDSRFVPGVLLCSHPVAAAEPRLQDLAPSILQQFGLSAPPAMTGQPIF
ncbi:MAG: hypothetical protein DWQ34_23870 [Planctomycetota bacterium]|nr:MAG: hypothetical protein DWQ34_23870 [Planctomycetota bacterium]REJ92567.1 MAG: hypothetical protein DWQ29_04615 [Planctomycetota bacterium]REK24986.1 MAG: hypothetical protein DWQ41_12980 [Planctomycetota bacterium]REK30548.1 MAG: hypothetical protein DWQ45_21980 [Planctomycetota bacterium]